MRTFLLALIFLSLGKNCFTQELTQNVRGSVVDKISKAPLPGCIIIVQTDSFRSGTVSDADGNYAVLSVPIGRITVSINYTGYAPATYSGIELFSAKELILNVELEENVYVTNEVVITAKDGGGPENISTNSSATILFSEGPRYAGTFGDPARTAANFAGVSGNGDMRNDIIVRGNSPLLIQWRVDGVAVPNPNHFSSLGATGGPVSILNNNTLASSGFMTGAFPAQYGNVLSGVFDLGLRTGNNKRREYTGQIGFNGLEIGAEGPIKASAGSSYLMHYRYSTFGLVKAMGIDFGISAVPEYQDVAFKLDFPMGVDRGRLSVFGIGGISRISMKQSENRDGDITFTDFAEDQVYKTGMGVIGVSHKYFLSEKVMQTTTLSASGSYIRSDIIRYFQPGFVARPFYGQHIKDAHCSVSYNLNAKINSRLSFRGMTAVEITSAEYVDSILRNNSFRYINNYSGTGFIAQSGITAQYKTANGLTYTPGIYYQYFGFNGTQVLEPRLGVKWQINEHHTVSLATGMHSQTQPLALYFIETNLPAAQRVRTNKDLGFTKAYHAVAGYVVSISNNMSLKSEIYYQYLYDIPVETRSSWFSFINAGGDFGLPLVDSLVNEGTGYNTGLELTLERQLADGYYFLITSSLYESRYKGSDGIDRNSAFNGNYMFNILAGKDIKLDREEKRVLSINGRYNLTGGKRYIPIDMERSRLYGQTIFDESHAYENRFKDYSRFDLRVGIVLNRKKVSQEIEIDIQNLFNTKNVQQQRYDVQSNSVVTQYQMGIFPMLKYKIMF